MHTCDGCVYLGSDRYTCLRDEANDRAAEKRETKRRNKNTGLLNGLLGIFGKKGKQ